MTVTTTKTGIEIRGKENEKIPVDEYGNTAKDIRPDMIITVSLDNVFVMPKTKLVTGNGMAYIGTHNTGRHIKAVIFEEDGDYSESVLGSDGYRSAE